MSEDARGRRAGPAIGVIGAAAAILSVWWFAFRPRRRDGGTPTNVDDLEG